MKPFNVIQYNQQKKENYLKGRLKPRYRLPAVLCLFIDHHHVSTEESGYLGRCSRCGDERLFIHDMG